MFVLETRLLPFGEAVGDSKAVDVSTITDERVTELIEVPSGVPLFYQTLNDSVRCRSLYVNEVLVFKNEFSVDYRELKT